MISGFIAKKGPMTNVFTADGKILAVTKCRLFPLTVTQIKTQEKDGYQSIQFACGTKKNLLKPISQKMKKLKLDDLKPAKFVEFKPTSNEIPQIGSQVTIDQVFAAGDKVSISGISKGHGFAGVIKRYGFQRQPVTGGQSDRVRAPGAIGAQTPGKVIKGKKMPGHYGNVKKNIKNLRIVAIDIPNNEVLISGSIPGHLNSWITISKNQ